MSNLALPGVTVASDGHRPACANCTKEFFNQSGSLVYDMLQITEAFGCNAYI